MKVFLYKPTNEYLGKFNIGSLDELHSELTNFHLSKPLNSYDYLECEGQTWTVLFEGKKLVLKDGRIKGGIKERIIEPQFVDVACKACGAISEAPKERNGTFSKCPACKEKVYIPRKQNYAVELVISTFVAITTIFLYACITGKFNNSFFSGITWTLYVSIILGATQIPTFIVLQSVKSKRLEKPKCFLYYSFVIPALVGLTSLHTIEYLSYILRELEAYRYEGYNSIPPVLKIDKASHIVLNLTAAFIVNITLFILPTFMLTSKKPKTSTIYLANNKMKIGTFVFILLLTVIEYYIGISAGSINIALIIFFFLIAFAIFVRGFKNYLELGSNVLKEVGSWGTIAYNWQEISDCQIVEQNSKPTLQLTTPNGHVHFVSSYETPLEEIRVKIQSKIKSNAKKAQP